METQLSSLVSVARRGRLRAAFSVAAFAAAALLTPVGSSWVRPAAAGPAAPSPPGAPGDVAPHRAAYKLSLHSARSSSQITDVRGAMSFEWGDACDGWTTEQRFQMNFVYAEGADDEMTTSYTTWEAKDGSLYRFNVRKTVNGEADEEVRGDARDSTAANGGQVAYVRPEPRKDKLPPGVLFPSAHTVTLLQRAAAGERFYTQLVFDGADEEGTTQVSAVIAKQSPLTTKVASPLLNDGKVWPVRMAFFPVAGDSAQPDYEMTVRLLGNGVAESMTIDYGDFVIDAALEKLEALGKPGC